MDANQILIIEHTLHSLQYLNVSYQFRSICWYKPFVEYQSLTSQMGYSKNRRTFSLYSGMIGTSLQNADLSALDNQWYYPSLPYACDWLQQNNPYLSAYNSIASHLLAHNSQTSPTVWP